VAIQDRSSSETFLHEALLYTGEADFVARTSRFVRSGLELEDSVFVVLGARKIAMLRSELGSDADRVSFIDRAEVGRNPARMIPVWRAFLESLGSGSRARGVGEPIRPGRSADELVECERHEALLNLAFAADDDRPWWLLCTYDTGTLEPSVIEEAKRNHPVVVERGVRRETDTFRGIEAISEPFDRPLPEPAFPTVDQIFDASRLAAVRASVADHARRSGLTSRKVDDLVLATSELVSNSVRYGGGRGVLRMWPAEGSVICEVKDEGHLDDPLAGRQRPDPGQASGFGLWLVNQLCDLVQMRSSPVGSTVRLHMAIHSV
jgi:anti-sigma regulatory factor (Ser/Thr protein kinase)